MFQKYLQINPSIYKMFQKYLQIVHKYLQNVLKVLAKYLKFKRVFFFQYLILAYYVKLFYSHINNNIIFSLTGDNNLEACHPEGLVQFTATHTRNYRN